MKNDGKHIDYDKLTAYIAGEGSAEERQSMKAWIDDSEENRQIYEQFKKTFELDYTADPDAANISPGNVVFDTDKAWNKVAQIVKFEEEEADNVIEFSPDIPDQQSKTIKSFPWLKIAASVLIGISVLYYLVYTPDAGQVVISFNEGINEHMLPDSSKIVLQGATEIAYDKNFNQRHRSLRLKGKAYFSVERNEALPFIVDTEYGQVKVLGTAFLVEENEKNMTVTVERGKVSFASQQSNLTSSVILEKGEQGILEIEKNIFHESKIANLNHLYWANRKLTYRQESLQNVLTELEAIFDREILYDSTAIADCRMTAVFKDQKFEDIIKNISASLQFDYVIADNRVEITSNGCIKN